MESATKSKLSPEMIGKMTAFAFPGLHAEKIEELGEGYFNAAYAVLLSDGREVILKVAPPKGIPVLTYEKDIMRAEVEGMRLVRKKTDLPVPEIYCYDKSWMLCPSEYYFMSRIEGQSFSSVSAEISEKEKSAVNVEYGKMNRKLNGITGEKFGYFAQPEMQGEDWFSTFSVMLGALFLNAEEMGISLAVRSDTVGSLLNGSRRVFDEVAVPRFVHWDLWAGNIFVKNGRITGIIDFERCLWADVLMEFGFRSAFENPDFLRGYGAAALTGAQKIRMVWYDLYYYLIMSMESEYRHYPNLDQKIWANKKVLESFNSLNSPQSVE